MVRVFSMLVVVGGGGSNKSTLNYPDGDAGLLKVVG